MYLYLCNTLKYTYCTVAVSCMCVTHWNIHTAPCLCYTLKYTACGVSVCNTHKYTHCSMSVSCMCVTHWNIHIVLCLCVTHWKIHTAPCLPVWDVGRANCLCVPVCVSVCVPECMSVFPALSFIQPCALHLQYPLPGTEPDYFLPSSSPLSLISASTSCSVWFISYRHIRIQ